MQNNLPLNWNDVPDCMYLIDKVSQVSTILNRPVWRLLDYRPAEVEQPQAAIPQQFLHSGDRVLVAKLFRYLNNLAHTGEYRRHLRFRCRKGGWRTFCLRISQYLPEPTKLLAVLTDITPEKDSFRRVQTKSRHLQRYTGDLERTLEIKAKREPHTLAAAKTPATKLSHEFAASQFAQAGTESFRVLGISDDPYCSSMISLFCTIMGIECLTVDIDMLGFSSDKTKDFNLILVHSTRCNESNTRIVDSLKRSGYQGAVYFLAQSPTAAAVPGSNGWLPHPLPYERFFQLVTSDHQLQG